MSAPKIQMPSRCPNCECLDVTNFCPNCGQEAGASVGPVREMALDAAGEFLHWDSKLFATLKGLLHPGFLTVQYLDGRRSRYISPLRVYLWASAIYFLIFSATAQKRVEQKFTPEAFRSQVNMRQQMNQGAAQGESVARAILPQRLAKKPAFDARKLKQINEVEEVARTGTLNVLANLATICLVLLFVEAGLLQMLYRRRQRWFVAHFITVLHINAALLLLTGPFLFLGGEHSSHMLWTLPFQAAFYFLALRRLYAPLGESWKKTLAKTLLFHFALGMIAIICLLGAGIALGVWFATHLK